MSENIKLHVAVALEEPVQVSINGRSHESPALIKCHTTLQFKVSNHIVTAAIKGRPRVFTKSHSFSVADYAKNVPPWNVSTRIT
jgi:hypothetical protein